MSHIFLLDTGGVDAADANRAPKGRLITAQANGLGLQNVSRLSPEGAVYETTVLPFMGS